MEKKAKLCEWTPHTTQHGLTLAQCEPAGRCAFDLLHGSCGVGSEHKAVFTSQIRQQGLAGRLVSKAPPGLAQVTSSPNYVLSVVSASAPIWGPCCSPSPGQGYLADEKKSGWMLEASS